MKTKLLVSLLLFFPVMAFILYRPAEKLNVNSISAESSISAVGGEDGRFLIGAVHSSKDESSNYVHYDSLGLNMWHIYTYTYLDPITNQYSPATTMAPNDNLLDSVSQYVGAIRDKILSINSHNQSRLILMRPKIEWLCYGQRSDYQCEDTHRDTALWFYSFQSAGHYGGVDSQDTKYAGGNWVRYFRSQNSTNSGSWVDNAGIVISKLKANTEQCRTGTGKTGNLWQTDEQFDWYIKPRIRIDSNVAHSSLNPLVCKIKVIAEDGSNVMKDINIKAENFLDTNGNYDGKYIEQYLRFPIGTNLTIHGAWGDSNKTNYNARGNLAPQSESNKVDIQVYWYGNCDMWIDYIRVDNEIADKLFKGFYEEPGKEWIKQEVEQIGLYNPTGASTPAAYKFYIELTEFNNFPCMAYVNKKIKQYSSDKLGLISDWTFRNSIHVPLGNRSTVMTAEFIKRFYIDSIGFNAFFAECYPYNTDSLDPATSNTIGRIPNTLPVTSCGGSAPCGIMAYPIPPNQFDDWLQDNMDHEPFYYSSDEQFNLKSYLWARGLSKFTLDLGDQISKAYNIPFILMPQSHSWYNPGIEMHNEPTNEELDLQANLAVTYGVRGLMYFAWNSSNQPAENQYARALTELDGSLRQENVYGQPKKQKMIDLVKRMKKWEPYIMSFDNANRKSYIVRNEMTNLTGETFFTDILSYKPDPAINFSPFPTSEPVSQRYLQAAVFKNPIEQYNKYFMIVNRRCSPYYSSQQNIENGGRFVKIKFDSGSSSFAGFNNPANVGVLFTNVSSVICCW